MKLKKIELPKKYEYKEGVTNPLYERFSNWNKISYSQYTSFKDYKEGYIQDYIMKVSDNQSGMFGEFGSCCGDFLNIDDNGEYPLLSDNDINILNTLKNTHPEGSIFEYEVLIDLEPFGLEKTCLQGFTDRQYPNGDKLNVNDYKTLTIKTKKAFYESEDYTQLYTYGYGLEELGNEIGDMYVVGLGRSGNNKIKGDKNVLRLSGEIITIPRPYCRDTAMKAVQKIADTCIEISEYFKVYNKFFNKNLQD